MLKNHCGSISQIREKQKLLKKPHFQIPILSTSSRETSSLRRP